MSVDYKDLLKKSRSSLPKVQLPPPGRGIFKLGQGKIYEPTKDDGNARVSIPARWQTVHPDSGLEAGAYNRNDFETVFVSIFLSGAGAYERVNEILDAAGMPADMATEEALKAIEGREVSAIVTHGERRDTGEPEARLNKFASL